MSRRVLALVAIVVVLSVFVIFLARILPSDKEQAARRPLTVQLQWEPSAQFLGFYVAKSRGLYAREGLDVRFLHGGPNVDPIANLAQGNAEVGLGTADQVLRWQAKHTNKPLRAFGTIFKRSLAVFMTHRDAGIRKPSDLRGKRVGVFPSYDTGSLLTLLLRRAKVPDAEVVRVNFPNFANFEQKELDAFGAYLINEPVLAKLRNIPVRLIDPVRFGLHFYSDTLIAQRSFFEKNFDIVRRFTEASAKGWALASADTPAALKDMQKEVGGVFGPGEAWKHQRLVAVEAVKYVAVVAGANMPFAMDRSIWKEMESALVEIGELPAAGFVDDLCDFSFVSQISTPAGK